MVVGNICNELNEALLKGEKFVAGGEVSCDIMLFPDLFYKALDNSIT